MNLDCQRAQDSKLRYTKTFFFKRISIVQNGETLKARAILNLDIIKLLSSKEYPWFKMERHSKQEQHLQCPVMMSFIC